MAFGSYWGAIRRSWAIILVITLLFGAAALTYSMRMTPMYQGQSQLFVSVRSSEGISGAYTGGLYVQQRMKSYVTVVDAPIVLQPVIDELQLDTTVGELAGLVAAQNPSSTVLLDVVALDAVPERAAAVADATARSLSREIVRLESLQSGGKPVRVELIRPATTPGTPITPRTRLNVALALVLGLILGIGLAILRFVLDTSLKSGEQLSDAAGGTLLGTIPKDPGAARNPLVIFDGKTSPEAFRSLRTNLQYVDIDNPPKSVIVTSCLPLEGKSTTAANLAIALAQGGASVLLIEADLRKPRIAEYLGVDNASGLTDVLTGRIALREAVVPWQRGMLDFLPAGAIPPNPSELLGSRQMSELLTELHSMYDMVLLDSPPLLPVTDAAVLTRVADGVILVARYGKTKYDQVIQAADALEQVNGRLFGVVLTFAPVKRRHKGYDYGYASEGKLESVTPEEPHLSKNPR